MPSNPAVARCAARIAPTCTSSVMGVSGPGSASGTPAALKTGYRGSIG